MCTVELEIVVGRVDDQLNLRRVLAASPSSVRVGVELLEQALATAGETTVVVEAASEEPCAFVQALRPNLHRIELASFDERVLVEAQRYRGKLRTTYLFAEPLRAATAAHTVGPRSDLVTHELVEGAHALGLRVVPWTVNDVREMTALVDLGVDGLVTDEPALAREVAAFRVAA